MTTRYELEVQIIIFEGTVCQILKQRCSSRRLYWVTVLLAREQKIEAAIHKSSPEWDNSKLGKHCLVIQMAESNFGCVISSGMM